MNTFDCEAPTPAHGVDSRDLVALWTAVKTMDSDFRQQLEREYEEVRATRLAFFANHWTPTIDSLDRTKRVAWLALGFSVAAFTLAITAGICVALALLVKR